jgi:osmotically-inducible protein OsmY
MWWLDGCEYVDNQLQIAPPEEDADNEITDAVRIVLEKDPLVHAGQLLVGTAGGVVVLNGSLASKEEKQLAIMDAWYVPGVADVVDRIEARS